MDELAERARRVAASEAAYAAPAMGLAPAVGLAAAAPPASRLSILAHLQRAHPPHAARRPAGATPPVGSASWRLQGASDRAPSADWVARSIHSPAALRLADATLATGGAICRSKLEYGEL